MFKRRELSAMSILKHVANSSKNVIYQNVYWSASKTLAPELNIDTVTTDAAASTALDLTSSVPESGNTVISKDLVSATEDAASTILDALPYVPEQGKQKL